ACLEEEATLPPLGVPRVVVQGDVEPGRPVWRLPKLRRGLREIVDKQRRAHIVAWEALCNRTTELDPALVRHIVQEALVVEGEAEGPADMEVREERRRDLQAVWDRARVDRLVVSENGDVKRGSILHNPKGRPPRGSGGAHHVVLPVSVDDGGVCVAGEEQELAGEDV